MVYLIAFILYSITGTFILIRILLNGIRPTKTLAWMLAVFTIPIGGMVLYFMLGRNRRKNKLFKLRNSDKIALYLEQLVNTKNSISDKEFKEHKKLISLINRNSYFPASNGNEFKLLKNGKTTFDAIFKALESAKNFIHIQYYIFEEGELATNLFVLLKRKVQEGVQVRILYDGIGSKSLSKKYIKSLKEIGVRLHSFLPIKFGKFLSSINYRNHRKIIIIDNLIGFTGGINISDKYINGDKDLGIWYDIHLRLEGPIVSYLQSIFVMDWHFISNEDEILKLAGITEFRKRGNAAAQIVYSDPDSDFSAIRQQFFSMITEAKEYIYITNPYIIPGEVILEALEVAALSGIDVRLLLSNNSDSSVVRWCVRSYFERLLHAGIKIHLLPDNFVHSKTIVVDDTVSSVGTANMDIRSFEQNYEVNVVIYENSFAISLKNDFINDCKESNQLDYQTFIKRPWKDRIKESLANILSPVL